MFGVLSEVWKTPFVDSWIVISKLRTVKTFFFGILSDTLVYNWATCFWIYRRNASLFHLPMTIIVSGDTPVRYIYIAAPEQMKCVPIYIGPNHNLPLPRIWSAARNFNRIPTEVIANLFSFRIHESVDLKFLCGSVPLYNWTGVLNFPHSRNGQ